MTAERAENVRHSRRSPDTQVAVLGGGISGSLTACLLHDLGHDTAIVEQREQLMDGASRWNDGKIHLGFTFTGSDSLATAALMQAGAAAFVGVLEQVTGSNIDDRYFGKPTMYIVDPSSIFDVDTLWLRAQRVARLLVESAQSELSLRDSLSCLPSGIDRVSPDVAMNETGQSSIVAAWRTAERHVSAAEIARRVRSAVDQRGIPVVRGRVESVSRAGSTWCTTVAGESDLSSTVVVNCLWESRALIDRLVAPTDRREPPVTIRYKRALFGSATGLDALTPSTRILGKFGDVATYGNGDAYLSWYPAGLVARSDDGVPPEIPAVDPRTVIDATLAGLGLPPETLAAPGAAWEVGGGFVVAPGNGDIDQTGSMLHRRDRGAVLELGPNYFTIDTGKYTIGPMLAQQAARLVDASLKRRREQTFRAAGS